jgi:uncharacterized protein (TIGR02145 family)
MKKILLTLMTIVILYSISNAQNDTMYVMKSGFVIAKYDLSLVDSITFYPPGTSFIDERDGNIYHTVTIGTQVWMKENLKYLPSVVPPTTGSYTIPYYYIYNYFGTDVVEAKSTEYYHTYGVLYNWNAVMNGSTSSSSNPSEVQGVCPTGWHVPSEDEWNELINFIGGDDYAGKLMNFGTNYWQEPNMYATNESGFTALPNSCRHENGQFDAYMGMYAGWWSATEENNIQSKTINLSYELFYLGRIDFDKRVGFAIRCVRD